MNKQNTANHPSLFMFKRRVFASTAMASSGRAHGSDDDAHWEKFWYEMRWDSDGDDAVAPPADTDLGDDDMEAPPLLEPEADEVDASKNEVVEPNAEKVDASKNEFVQRKAEKVDASKNEIVEPKAEQNRTSQVGPSNRRRTVRLHRRPLEEAGSRLLLAFIACGSRGKPVHQGGHSAASPASSGVSASRSPAD